MAKKWPSKDPDEVLEYGFNWSPRLPEGDQILTTTATVESGSVAVDHHYVGVVDEARDSQGTITWLSGGAAGDECEINLRASTLDGRTLDQTMKIRIKDR